MSAKAMELIYTSAKQAKADALIDSSFMKGESQLIGFPTQYPSVSMVDWCDGTPNAALLVLKLLRDNFSSGDKTGRE